MTKELQNNPELFEPGGVIGRMDYFINSMKLTGLAILAFIPVGIGSAMGSAGLGLGGIITLGCILPVVFYGFHNNFKRLRDIRGTTKDELTANIIMCLLMAIPYIGAFVNIIMLFAEGKVTGHGAGLGKVEQVFQSSPKQPENNEGEKIANIEKLHKLKEAGAITNEEFNKYKEEALKKIAS